MRCRWPLALAGCDISVGHLAGRATDEWTRTYPLAAGGELQIGNQNGTVDIEGTDGTTVEVRAERIAKAATDAGARELLPRIKINEDVSASRVADRDRDAWRASCSARPSRSAIT